MKTILAFLTVLAVLCHCEAANKCSDASDCESGECCVGSGIFVLFRKGECSKLAEEGDSCNEEGIMVKDKYMYHCPCADGLTCEAENRIGPMKFNERCVSDKGTTTTATTVGEDTTSSTPEVQEQ